MGESKPRTHNLHDLETAVHLVEIYAHTGDTQEFVYNVTNLEPVCDDVEMSSLLRSFTT